MRKGKKKNQATIPAKVYSPQYPDQRTVYGESRGVSRVFLRPKLKTAIRCGPTVPTELQREKVRPH